MLLNTFYLLSALTLCTIAFTNIVILGIRFKSRALFLCSITLGTWSLGLSLLILNLLNEVSSQLLTPIILSIFFISTISTPLIRKDFDVPYAKVITGINSLVFITMISLQLSTIFIPSSIIITLAYLVLPCISIIITSIYASLHLSSESFEKSLFSRFKCLNLIALIAIIDSISIYQIMSGKSGDVIPVFAIYIIIISSSLIYKSIHYYKSIEGDLQVSESVLSKLSQFTLSEREKEVAIQILKGASNAEIGKTLFLSENTIKQHVNAIYKKCHVQSRWRLFALFLR